MAESILMYPNGIVRDDTYFGGLRPDFVLEGLNRPVVVEVYGRVGDPSYDEQKENRQVLYQK